MYWLNISGQCSNFKVLLLPHYNVFIRELCSCMKASKTHCFLIQKTFKFYSLSENNMIYKQELVRFILISLFQRKYYPAQCFSVWPMVSFSGPNSTLRKISLDFPLNLSPLTFYEFPLTTGTLAPTTMRHRWHNTIMMRNLLRIQPKRQR